MGNRSTLDCHVALIFQAREKFCRWLARWSGQWAAFPEGSSRWVPGIVLASLFFVPATAQARLCGTQWLRQNQQRLSLPAAKVLAPQQEAGEIKVGTPLKFVVAGDALLRPATCRYAGEHCYIFVEDDQWDVIVAQADVDRLGRLFDHSTPADSARGIYDLGVEAFGEPADVDGDPRVFIVVLELGDPQLVGYFDQRVATYPDSTLRRDTLYLDASRLTFSPYLAQGTLAHEFQHLIHWGHDPDEESWVDEGLSGYAEALTGFPETDPTMVPEFLKQPDFDLTVWPVRAEAANYGATYLFAAFLAEHYGTELIRRVVAEPRNGTFGYDEAFKKGGQVQNFAGAWAEWIAGNYASDDELYGYRALRGRRVLTFTAPMLPFEAVQGNVNRQWGTTNVLIRAPGNVAVEFSGEEGGRYVVWAYAMRGNAGEMVQLELDGANRGEVQLARVDSIAVVVGRTSRTGRLFSLSARLFVPALVRGEEGGLPLDFALGAAYPNPFNGQVALPFELPAQGEMELAVYNGLGQRVRVLRRGVLEKGRYEEVWDGRDQGGQEVAGGVYAAVLRAGARKRVSKVVFLK